MLSLAACGVPSGTSHSTNTNPRQLTYPERVEQVSWKWEVPENFQIVDIIPVPGGVAVLLDDGFVVLAGDTGEEVWEYRAGESARAAYASYLGDYLAVEIEDSDKAPALVEFDPSTGEILQHISIDETSSNENGIDKGSFSQNVAKGVRIARDPFDDPALRALSLETGENLWVREEPPECDTVTGPITDTTAGTVLGEIVLEGFFCTGGEDGSGLLGRDLLTGEELWRFEEGFGPSEPNLSAPQIHYDPITDRHLTVRSLNGPTRVFDVVTGDLLGEWDGAVVGVLDDDSVVAWYTEDREYRREHLTGEILDVIPVPQGTDRSSYPVVLEGGVVSHGNHTRDLDVQVWFHPWKDGEKPLSIEVSDFPFDTDSAISTIAVPGAVVLSYTKKSEDDRQVLLGLT